MNTDKLMHRMKLLAIAKAGSEIAMWICFALIGIEAIIYTHDHGLKDLLELIWYGPKS